MKKTLIALLVTAFLAGSAHACITVMVDKQASNDGSYLLGRNEDFSATSAKHMMIHPAVKTQHGNYTSSANAFTWPLPENSLRYNGIHDFDTNGNSMAEVGFNEMGVGISATESIDSNPQVLKLDPWVKKDGINEDSIPSVLLPEAHSAKEAVQLLGKIIEQKGAAEGFGVAFVDKDELWYLETGSGHQWMATRIPDGHYFVSANQGRLREYAHDDGKATYLASPGLLSFAEKNGLYDPKKESFDFHHVYSQDVKADQVYNYPRVWVTQHKFNPELKTTLDDDKNFPVFLKPQQKISVADVASALRNHYEGTQYDAYANNNPKERLRPASVFRTMESHILQVRPNLPVAIGEVEYLAFGMPSLSVYIPYYQGTEHYLPGYDKGTDKASPDSVNWKYRTLQTLVMQDYNAYAPDVQKAYAAFEKHTAQQQREMENQYITLYKTQPQKAQRLLQDFEDKVMQDGLTLTDQLTQQVITKMTVKTDRKYHFSGA